MAHLGGGDRWVLAKLGSQGGVGSAQRVEGDAIGNRRPVFGCEAFVGSLDGRVEYANADAVALARLVAESTGEYEVVGQASLGGALVLAE